MIIAVDADFRGVAAAIEQQFFLAENLFLGGENFLGFFPEFFGQVGQLLLQQGEGATQRSSHVLINRALRHGVERLRRKRAIVAIGSKRVMQLAGALAEQLCFLGINAADQFIEKRCLGRGFILQIAFLGQDAVVKTADGIKRQFPGVALSRDRVLQQTNNRRLVFWSTPILNRAAKGGNILESGALGQEARDFDVGIYAVFQLAREF